jgi:beta-glucosidase
MNQWGWGAPLVAFFDLKKINVVNRAFGGTSSRSFYDGFFWQNLLPQIKKGDFVMMQFGANDNGNASGKGIGPETQDVVRAGKTNIVHTFGWYLQRFATETRAQGATPIICSLTPRKAWTSDGHFRRDNTTHAAWAAEVAKSNDVPFVDLYELIARKYESLGTNAVDKLYVPSPREKLHTGWDGAVINAGCVIAGLKGLKDDPLAPFLSARADSIAPVVVTPAAPTPAGGSNAPPLYLDVNAPVDARVADLISRLTLEEKAILLNHVGPTIQRFNIRADQWNQCLNGVQWDRPTTLFPSCIAMAATWDTNLVHETATALSDEARAIYNGWHLDPDAPGQHKGLIYRDPVINIERNPYWGRNHEAWGEDPFLTGRMAVNYVEGLQGDDPHHLKIAATLKHFAVYNVETDRHSLNAVVPERMLHEYYLPHWREAVLEGEPQSVMASYNAINGTPNNINHWLLTDILKDDWGFQGFVVSDLGGVRTMVQGHEKNQMTLEDAVVQSLMAGCDFSDKEYQDNIPAAVRDGKLTEARLDDAVTRLLRVRFRLGEFDPFNSVPYSNISTNVINDAAHRALSLKVAQESIVLLQNRGGLLPLDNKKLKSIAVIGPLADRIVLNNYNGKTGGTVTALQGIKDRVAPGTEVSYAAGGAVVDPSPGGQPFDRAAELQKAAALARNADVALVFVGTDRDVEQEGRDRKTLGLTGNQEELVEAVLAANPRTVVVEMSAGPLTVPWIAKNAPAILEAWWPGEEGGHAIADVLFGNVNPAGRLPHTVYASEAQVPPQDEYDITKGFTYMYVSGKPLFPFGHGLSYTTFKYSGLKLSADKIRADGQVNIRLDVKNTGKRAGDEVVQLYVHQEKSNVKVPVKELRGFQRISLKPGEKQTVAFTLPAAKLAIWDETTHGFVVEPGAFDVMVGASSADIRLKDQIEVTR